MIHNFHLGQYDLYYDDDLGEHLDHDLGEHLAHDLDHDDPGDCHAATSTADPACAGQLPE